MVFEDTIARAPEEPLPRSASINKECLMALPKKKTSKSRKNMRRAHDHCATPNVVLCKCGEPVLSHRACSACGNYKDRQAVSTANA